MRNKENGRVEQSLVFDEEQFAKASANDSAMMLARQLPLADAEKCAALANEMLTKRVQVEVKIASDTDSTQKIFEEKMLPDYVWEGLFKRWMQVAPQAAWAFVEKHQSEELPLRLVALRPWALLDPLAAAKAAGKTISEEEQIAIVKACIEISPAIGLNLLVEWGVDLSEYENTAYPEDDSLAGAMSASLAKYAEKSPREALEFCQRHSPKLVSDVCAGWMRKDAAVCLAWIQELPHEEQISILQSLTYESDVSAETVRHLAVLCEPSEFRDMISGGLSSIAQRDVSLAQSLIDELFANPTDRLSLRDSIADEMRVADPRKAMDFVGLSLREPLPIFDGPAEILLQMRAGAQFDLGPDICHASGIFSEYLDLGQAAGVTKEEVLRRLNEIHPQYRKWMMGENLEALKNILGRPSEWMSSLAENMPREDIHDVIESLYYSSSSQVIQEMNSVPQGSFRNALAQQSIDMMLEENEPVASVVEKAKEWGGALDWSGIYDSWSEQSPDEAVNHLMSRPNATEAEWSAVIDGTYASHSQLLENTVEKMPQGLVREAAVGSLASVIMTEKKDVVTSLYWASEMKNRSDRNKLIQQIWNDWQDDDTTSQDPQMIEGVRQNIEHSTLDAREKALWLDRLESEVLR
jgi:hypothetical protein